MKKTGQIKNIVIALALAIGFLMTNELIMAISSTGRSSICVGECPASYGGWMTDPEHSRVSSCFGERSRPCTGCSTNHKGIDIGVPEGTPIYATANGTVTAASFESCGGNTLTVTDDNGYRHQNLHMSRFAVSVGDSVSVGELIGYSGNTGSCTTGPHIHFQIGNPEGGFSNPCCFVDCSGAQFSGSNCAENNNNECTDTMF